MAAAEGLADHPLAGAIRDLPALRLFMEHHVFAVWDFLQLTRALQRQLAAEVEASGRGGQALHAAQRLLDGIVAEEECDEAPANSQGASRLSHLQIYRLAMAEVGARTGPIEALIERFAGEDPSSLGETALPASLAGLPIPAPSRRFLAFTFEVIGSRNALIMAAAFTHGRELLVPQLFQTLLDHCPVTADQAPCLHWYLRRHIALDGEEHGPAALAMLEALGGAAPAGRWRSEAIARRAVAARREFWDGIHAALLQARRPDGLVRCAEETVHRPSAPRSSAPITLRCIT